MTNDEIVARSICKSLNMDNDQFWAAYQGEARAVLTALSSAGRLVGEAPYTAPEAMDWKAQFYALCDKYVERVTAAQAENEKLRGFASWVDVWVSNPVGAYSVLALDGLFKEARERLAALSPPPLPPETP